MMNSRGRARSRAHEQQERSERSPARALTLTSASTSNSRSPPPPPASVLGDDYARRLAQKVQMQAKEIMDLHADVEERVEYIALCEQFVVALEPAQPLPLSAECLHAVKLKAEKEKQGSPGRINGKSRHTLTTLTRQHEAMCKKMGEQQVKMEENEKALAEALQYREVAERRISAIQQKLADAQAKVNQMRRVAPAKAQMDEEMAAMGHRVEEVEMEKRRLNASLVEQSRLNEEQRVYIDVLQSALKSRAEELGLDPDQILNVEKAKFDVIAAKGSIERLEKAERELENKSQDLEEKLRLEKLRHQQTKNRLAWYEPESQAQSSDVGDSSERSLSGLPRSPRRLSLRNKEFKSEQSGEEEGDEREEGERFSVDGLRLKLQRLKQENNALLDYIRETVEPLKTEKRELEESLEATANALDESKSEELHLQSKLKAVQDKSDLQNVRLLEKDVELNAARESRDTQAQERQDAFKALEKVEEEKKQVEIDLEAREKQIIQLEAKLEALENASLGVAETQQQLTDTQKALRCERRELVVAEEKRAVLEQKSKDLEQSVSTLTAKLGRSETERAEMEQEQQTMRLRVNELRAQLEEANTTLDSLHQKVADANEVLGPLRAFKLRAMQIEKFIATHWTEGNTPQTSLESLNSMFQKLSSVSMQSNLSARPATGTSPDDDFGFSRHESVPDMSAMSSLESLLPNLNALLFSAKTQVSRSISTQDRLKQELNAAEKRFEVEKRLLHDEIHSLRTKFDKVSELRKEREYNESQERAGNDNHEKVSSESNELALLRQRYAILEARYIAMEERLAETRTSPPSAPSGFDFPQSALRNVQSKLDHATSQSDQIVSLRHDLEKAARLLKDHENLTRQLEEQLVEAEDELHHLQSDLDMSKRLCAATMKGIMVRYKNSHGAVQQFFLDRHAPGTSETMEQAVMPLCELIEAILEHDTKVATSDMDHLAQSLDNFRREQLSVLGSLRPLADPHQNSRSTLGHRRDRGSSTATNSRIQELNASLLRAQKVVDETRMRLEHEMEQQDMDRHRHDDVYLSADNQSSDDDISVSTRGVTRARSHARPDGVGGDGRTRTVRARSPARVRVYRDGSIQVSTFENEEEDGEREHEDIKETLRRAAKRLDQIERIRKGTTSRPDTPLARRYRQQFRVAQEKFRRLNMNSKS